MAQKAKAKVLFLFVDEIRAAAAAMERFMAITAKPREGVSSEEYANAMGEALQLSFAALRGADDERNELVLCKKDIFSEPKKVAKSL